MFQLLHVSDRNFALIREALLEKLRINPIYSISFANYYQELVDQDFQDRGPAQRHDGVAGGGHRQLRRLRAEPVHRQQLPPPHAAVHRRGLLPRLCDQ